MGPASRPRKKLSRIKSLDGFEENNFFNKFLALSESASLQSGRKKEKASAFPQRVSFFFLPFLCPTNNRRTKSKKRGKGGLKNKIKCVCSALKLAGCSEHM